MLFCYKTWNLFIDRKSHTFEENDKFPDPNGGVAKRVKDNSITARDSFARGRHFVVYFETSPSLPA